MTFEEVKESYRNMTFIELGETTKKRLNVEKQVFDEIGRQPEELIQAAVYKVYEHYLALDLPFRNFTFLSKFYKKGVEAGLKLDWWKSGYLSYLDNALKTAGNDSFETRINHFVNKHGEHYDFKSVNASKTPAKTQKILDKARASFADYPNNEIPLFYIAESVFGFSKGFVATDKRICFKTDKIFSVKYENIADIYMENTYGENVCSFFNVDIMDLYCSTDPDCFSKGTWLMKIAYYDELTGELKFNNFRNFLVDNLEYVTYMWNIKDLIMEEVFIRHCREYKKISDMRMNGNN